MSEPIYEPHGIRFFDAVSNREMILVADGEPFAGWLCYRHPDGQWVTLRKATEEDRNNLLINDLLNLLSNWLAEWPEGLEEYPTDKEMINLSRFANWVYLRYSKR